jgi:hypothetical protein
MEEAMFELTVPSDGIEECYRDYAVGKQDIADLMPAPRTFLPRRSGESHFAPHQYYYPASKTGVVPSWRLAM